MADTKKTLKVVFVGDGDVGKTSLIQYSNDANFSEDYAPTVFDTTAKVVSYNGEVYDLTLWDTAGSSSLKFWDGAEQEPIQLNVSRAETYE